MQRQIGAESRIAVIAGVQGGRISRAQLLSVGLGAGAIDHRVRTGRLHPRQRGVYAVGSPADTRDGTWWEALLACGAGAALSHATAAEAYELEQGRGGPVEVTTSQTGIGDRPGIRVRYSRVLLSDEVISVRGMRATSPARTVLDLASRSGPRDVERLIERGIAQGTLILDDLERALARHRGRRGTPRLRAALARYVPTITRSDLEERFLALCERFGLPRPIVNARVEGLEVDAHWPGTDLIVELDGYAYHRSPAAFERDRARDVRLVLAGYRVVRFTYRQIADDPAGVAHSIGTLLGL